MIFPFGRKKDTPSVESSELLRRQLDAIQIVSAELINQSNLDAVLSKVVDMLTNKLKYLNSSIYFYNQSKTSYSVKKVNVPQAVLNVTERVVGKSIYDVELSTEGDNIVAQVLRSGETVISKSLYDLFKPLFTTGQADLIQRIFGMKTFVLTPIKIESEVMGCLAIGTSAEQVNKSEIELLETFANQISIAIYNSQQYEAIQGQNLQLQDQNRDLQSTFNLVSNISKTLDPQQIAQVAVDSLPQESDMIGAVLSRYIPQEQKLVVNTVSRNTFSDAVRAVVGDFQNYALMVNDEATQRNISVQALKTKSIAFSDDIADFIFPSLPEQLLAPVKKLLPVKSIVAFPILFGNDVIGTISYFLRSSSYSALDERKRKLLETFTLQISAALQNALLYQQSRDHQVQLEHAISALEEVRRKERDMVDIMGHELRTPITTVRNALYLMDKQRVALGDLPPEVESKYIGMALDSTRREITLIETLLSATKVDSRGFDLNLTKVNLLEVVEATFVALKATADQKGLQLILTNKMGDRVPEVYCDRVRIGEISDNLIGNAIKYTPKGSVEVILELEADFIWLRVKDTGIGISPEDIQHLGKKFFRAKQYVKSENGSDEPKLQIARAGGTGLGLYVSINLTELMDGKFDIQSTLGQGSVFSCAMPVYNGQLDQNVQRKVKGSDDSIRTDL